MGVDRSDQLARRKIILAAAISQQIFLRGRWQGIAPKLGACLTNQSYYRVAALFFKVGQPRPLFGLFSSFRTVSRIRTQIVGVEGKDADHPTATTALQLYFYLLMVSLVKLLLYGLPIILLDLPCVG